MIIRLTQELKNSDTNNTDVIEFYNRLVFPSKVSHNAYEELVDLGLTGKVVGDFGCGQSLFQDAFRKLDCDAIFLDIAPNALLGITYRKKILASLTDIPLPNEHSLCCQTE